RGGDADLGRAAHLSAQLQADLRRGRVDEPLRDHAGGRLGRAHEPGAGVAVAGAIAPHLSACGVAEPGAGRRVGLHALDPDDEAVNPRADVSADTGGAGRGDAGAGAIILGGANYESRIFLEIVCRCFRTACRLARAHFSKRATRDFLNRDDGEAALPERRGCLARLPEAPLLCARPEALRA